MNIKGRKNKLKSKEFDRLKKTLWAFNEISISGFAPKDDFA